MRDLAVRLENRAAEAAELRTRLELTERTQSTIEEERKQLRERVEYCRQN
jgi:predicted nuclease with TOPRIM domain